MTASSKETGLPWSEGSDLVKSIPATEQMRDRQLAGALTLTAVSEQDLLSRFCRSVRMITGGCVSPP